MSLCHYTNQCEWENHMVCYQLTGNIGVSPLKNLGKVCMLVWKAVYHNITVTTSQTYVQFNWS